MTSAYQQLFVGLAFAIVLIYLLIVVDFQSWLDPFVIVMALPSALAGIVWMLFATGTSAVRAGADRRHHVHGRRDREQRPGDQLRPRTARRRGRGAWRRPWRPARTRFRPVLMTALAMIIGMLPMAIEPGQNAPLGRAVIGGLLFATCATLFLVPTLFSIVHGRDRKPAETSAPAGAISARIPLHPEGTEDHVP